MYNKKWKTFKGRKNYVRLPSGTRSQRRSRQNTTGYCKHTEYKAWNSEGWRRTGLWCGNACDGCLRWKELARVKEEQAKGKFATFISRAQDIEGGKLFISKIENFDADAVKAGVELLGNKLGDSVIVLASERMVIAKVSDSFVQKGINAGKIVGEIARATGANGGGRPNFAQGGVKDASKLDEILAKIEADIKG